MFVRCAVNDQISLFISQYSTVQYSTEQLGCLTRAVGRRECDVSAAAMSRPMRRWRHLAGNLDQ